MKQPRKRILLVARHPVGGILTYFKYIYSQTCFDEYDFTVLVPDAKLASVMEKIFIKRNLSFLYCRDSKSMFWMSRAYLSSNKVDLVHTHGFTAGSLLSLITPYYKTPHLMTAHDVFQKKQFLGYKGVIKKWLLSRLFCRIDKIHTVSHDATNDMLEFFPKINSQHIKCIPHGIDTERFYFSVKQDIDLNYDRQHTCLIGFFGRFMAQKGFRYLVNAVETLVNEGMINKKPLVLTFDWGGFVREEYQNIESRGLNNYFHMMQYTENMPGTIKAMDMVVMPSLWESCGLLGMESLVSGIPIIGSSCIGLREVLNDSPAVLVPPKNSKSLAIAIANEINKPSKKVYEEFVQVARKRFSIQPPSIELKNLYETMIR